MVLNPYFHRRESGISPYFNQNGQNGIQTEVETFRTMFEEAIRMRGLRIKYVVREFVKYDEVFGEDISSSFKKTFDIEAMMEGQSFMTNDSIQAFGISIQDTVTLCVSARRLMEEFIKVGLPGRLPMSGDLILFDISGVLLEIKYIDDKDPYWPLGDQIQYKFKCEMFDFNDESFQTGVEEIDVLNTFDDYVRPEEQDNDRINTEAADITLDDEPTIWTDLTVPVPITAIPDVTDKSDQFGKP